jgi:hypothetical protein
MQEIEITHTAPVLTISPLELLELSEAAQKRAALVKAIAAETEAIGAETVDWHTISEQNEPRGLERAATAADQLPIMERTRRVLISSSVVIFGLVALIWAVVHFAPIIDAWIVPSWCKVLSVGVLVGLIVAGGIKKGWRP